MAAHRAAGAAAAHRAAAAGAAGEERQPLVHHQGATRSLCSCVALDCLFFLLARVRQSMLLIPSAIVWPPPKLLQGAALCSCELGTAYFCLPSQKLALCPGISCGMVRPLGVLGALANLAKIRKAVQCTTN